MPYALNLHNVACHIYSIKNILLKKNQLSHSGKKAAMGEVGGAPAGCVKADVGQERPASPTSVSVSQSWGVGRDGERKYLLAFPLGLRHSRDRSRES